MTEAAAQPRKIIFRPSLPASRCLCNQGSKIRHPWLHTAGKQQKKLPRHRFIGGKILFIAAQFHRLALFSQTSRRRELLAKRCLIASLKLLETFHSQKLRNFFGSFSAFSVTVFVHKRTSTCSAKNGGDSVRMAGGWEVAQRKTFKLKQIFVPLFPMAIRYKRHERRCDRSWHWQMAVHAVDVWTFLQRNDRNLFGSARLRKRN